MFWKLVLAIVAIAGVGGVALLSGVSKEHVLESLKSHLATSKASDPPATRQFSFHQETPKWDGQVALTENEEEAIGLRTTRVEAQTMPIKLELTGRTAYDPDTLTKIRPRFDTQVDTVHATLGQRVKKGEPLVDLFSTDLAQAKSDFQTKYVQWQHDKRLLEAREDLYQKNAISKQQLVDTRNDEKKSFLDFTLARDKLKVYKVPDDQIDPLLIGLGDEKVEVVQFGRLEDKAKMTLVSPTDGIVIEREVVPGNFYETSSVLMVIAPLDHLWVWVNVYELDQDKVGVGQTMEIQFPYLAEKIQGRVQYVANEVAKDTRAIKIRAQIPNPDTRLKSDMSVKALLDIPPLPGQTVIPRMAMVSMNGHDYVFVRTHQRTDPKDTDRFERQPIQVAQESSDRVVVHTGLKPGQVVATTGSLILSQIDEDQRTVDTGLPPP
jgi:cobalt-zinc-cadmium efflux system membrane fusion protein